MIPTERHIGCFVTREEVSRRVESLQSAMRSGGLAVATELQCLLGDDHDIKLIDQREHFLMRLRKLYGDN